MTMMKIPSHKTFYAYGYGHLRFSEVTPDGVEKHKDDDHDPDLPPKDLLHTYGQWQTGGRGQSVSYDFGEGKRTMERTLQDTSWRPQKMRLVWSAPVSKKGNDRVWRNKGGNMSQMGESKHFGEGSHGMCSPPLSFPPPFAALWCVIMVVYTCDLSNLYFDWLEQTISFQNGAPRLCNQEPLATHCTSRSSFRHSAEYQPYMRTFVSSDCSGQLTSQSCSRTCYSIHILFLIVGRLSLNPTGADVFGPCTATGMQKTAFSRRTPPHSLDLITNTDIKFCEVSCFQCSTGF